MAVVQIEGSWDRWAQFPRAIFLGERGSRVLLIRADDQGRPYIVEERKSEVGAPVWALQEDFPTEIPRR